MKITLNKIQDKEGNTIQFIPPFEFTSKEVGDGMVEVEDDELTMSILCPASVVLHDIKNWMVYAWHTYAMAEDDTLESSALALKWRIRRRAVAIKAGG